MEGMKVTEVIARPATNQTLNKDQQGKTSGQADGMRLSKTQPLAQSTLIDKDTASYFGLLLPSENDLSQSQSVEAQVLESRVDHEITVKDLSLIQSLITPKIIPIQDQPEISTIKVTSIGKDGKNNTNSISIVDPTKVSLYQSKAKEELVNDIVAELGRINAIGLEGSERRASQVQINQPGRQTIYREIPKEELPLNTTQIDKLLLSKLDTDKPEVIQRIIIKDISTPSEGEQPIKAVFQVESLTEDGKKSIIEYNCIKRPDGSFLMVKNEDANFGQSNSNRIEMTPSVTLTRDLSILSRLIESKPPALDLSGNPVKIKSDGKNVIVDKIGQGQASGDVGQMQSSMLVSQLIRPRTSVIQERVVFDPADIIGKTSRLTVIKEKPSMNNPSETVIEKLDISSQGILESKILGISQKSQLPGANQQNKEISNVYSTINNLGLSQLVKGELLPAAAFLNDPDQAVDPELSQILPYILPAGSDNRYETVTVQVREEGNDKIFEIFQIVGHCADKDAKEIGSGGHPIGLITQKVRVLNHRQSVGKWNVIKDLISQAGDAQRETFEIPKISEAEILSKSVKRSEPSNKRSQRTYKDPKIIENASEISKGLELCEISNINLKWIRELQSTCSLKGKEIVILTEKGDSIELIKYLIPVEGICYCKILERVKFDKPTGRGVHIYSGKTGSVLEEFQQGKTPDDIQIVNKVEIGPSQQELNQSDVSLMQRTMEPMGSEIFEKSELTPTPTGTSRHQTVIRESTINNETSQIVFPIESNYDLAVPPCLEYQKVDVNQRQVQETSNILANQLLQSLQNRSKTLKALGGIENLFSFMPAEISKDVTKNSFILARLTSEGLLMDKVEVQQNPGDLKDNIVLISNVLMSYPQHSSRIEDLRIIKRAAIDPENTQVINYKLSKDEGTPMINKSTSRILENTSTEKAPIGLANLLPAGAESQFLRMAFASHEYGSHYLLLNDPSSSKEEWMKVQLTKGQNPDALLKEIWKFVLRKEGGLVDIDRTISEDGKRIEEQITIGSKDSQPAKGQARRHSMIVAHPKKLATIGNTWMKLKKKVKTLRSDSVNIKLQEYPAEDGLDSIRVKPIPGVLKDLLDLSFKAEDAPRTPYQKRINLFEISEDRAVFKVVDLKQSGNERLRSISQMNPQTLISSEVQRTAQVKPIAAILAECLVSESIIDQAAINLNPTRENYLLISRISIDPSSQTKKNETYEAVRNLGDISETLVKSQEKTERIDSGEQQRDSISLKHYLNFICNLLKAPENLQKPNAILAKRVQGDKMLVTRGDLVKELTENDSDSLNMYVREELVIDKAILDAFYITGSDGQDSTNFTSEDAARLIEKKINEYRNSKVPELIEKLNIKRSSVHDGSVVVDTIRLSVKDGRFDNKIQERKIIEMANETECLINIEKISENMALVLKTVAKQREELGTSTKTIGLIEETEDGEISISQLKLNTVPGAYLKPPMNWTLDDFVLNRIKKLTFDPSASKYNFVLDKDASLEAKSESVTLGNKIQIDTVKIGQDMTQQQLETFTLPKMPDWETQLSLLELERAYKRAGVNSSKPNCFIQRCEEDDKIRYKVVEFEQIMGENVLTVIEEFHIDKLEDSQLSDIKDRPTIRMTEDYFYDRLASPVKKGPVIKPLKIDENLMKNVKSTRMDESEGVKPTNIFESLIGDNPLAMVDDEEDDEIVERKSIRPMLSRSTIGGGGQKNKHARPIVSPLIAALKAIENMKLPEDQVKDTILVQRALGGKCIFELLKVKTDSASGSKSFETIARLTTPSERTHFEAMDVTREKFNNITDSMVIDQLKITPHGDITKLSTQVIPSASGGRLDSPRDRLDSPRGAIGVEDVVTNLSNYLKMIRKEPFYLKIVDETPTKLTVETVEILDQFEEIIRERIDIQKESPRQVKDSLTYLITRTLMTPDGQILEDLEYQKEIGLEDARSSSVVKMGKNLVRVLNIKSAKDNLSKPYKNNQRERVEAEKIGMMPSSASKPFDLEQVLEEAAKRCGASPYLVKEEIKGDQKIISTYRLSDQGIEPELIERFTIDLKDIQGIPGAIQSQLPTTQRRNSEFIIKPEKQEDGSNKVKVFKVIKKENKDKPSAKLSSSFREEEKKKWKITLSTFEDPSRLSIMPGQADSDSDRLLEIEQYTISPSEEITENIKPLGQIVAITNDGEPVYEKQIGDYDPSHDDETGRGAGINVVEYAAPRTAAGFNMFGSMEELEQNGNQGQAGRQSGRDQTGKSINISRGENPRVSAADNMFGLIIGSENELNQGQSQGNTQNTGARGSINIIGTADPGATMGLNMFGSMVDSNSNADPRRASQTQKDQTKLRSGGKLRVHPALEQATPKELAIYYKEQVNDQLLSPEDQNIILKDLISKLETSVKATEAENIRKELDTKDKQITEMISSTYTADFGTTLRTKDDEVIQLRDDKKNLQENIEELLAKITMLQVKISVPQEDYSAALDKVDKSFNGVLEKLVDTLNQQQVTAKPPSTDLSEKNITLANKANLREVLLCTWKLLDDLEKRNKQSGVRASSLTQDPTLDKLRAENSDLREDLERSSSSIKELKDKLSYLEVSNIRTPSFGAKSLMIPGQQGDIDSTTAKMISDLMDEIAERNIEASSYPLKQEPIVVDRRQIKDLMTATREALSKLAKSEDLTKDLQADLQAAKNKLLYSSGAPLDDSSKKLIQLENELADRKKNFTALETMNRSLQTDNNRSRSELEDAKKNFSTRIDSSRKDTDIERQLKENLQRDVANLKDVVAQRDAQIMGIASGNNSTQVQDIEKSVLRDQVARAHADSDKLNEEKRLANMRIKDLQSQVTHAEERVKAVEVSRMNEVASLQSTIEVLRQNQRLTPGQIPTQAGLQYDPAHLLKIKEEIDSMTRSLKLKEGDLKSEKDENERLRQDVKQLKNDLAQKDNMLLSATTAARPRDESDPEKDLLRDQLARTKAEVENMAEDSRKSNLKIRDLEGKVMNAEERAKSIDESRKTEVANLQKSIDTLRQSQSNKPADMAGVITESAQLLKMRDDLEISFRNLKNVEADLKSEKYENDRLMDDANFLKNIVAARDTTIIELTSASTQKEPANQTDPEKVMLESKLLDSTRQAVLLQDEIKKIELQNKDLESQIRHTQDRLKDLENSKKSEAANLQKTIDGLRQELSSRAALQIPSKSMEDSKDIARLTDELSSMGKVNRDLESRLRSAISQADDMQQVNNELKDQLAQLEIKVIEASSPILKTAKSGKENKPVSADPEYDDKIKKSLDLIGQLDFKIPTETKDDQIVSVSLNRLNQLNTIVPSLIERLKDEDDKQKDIDHKLQIAIQRSESLSSELNKAKEAYQKKTDSLTNEIDAANKNYKIVLDDLHEAQRRAAESPKKSLNQVEPSSEAKIRESTMRDQIKDLKDKISALETENTLLKSTEAIGSPMKQPVVEVLERIEPELDQAINLAKNAGINIGIPKSNNDVVSEQSRVRETIACLKEALARIQSLTSEKSGIESDFLAAKERIEKIQKSLIKSAEEYKTKSEEKDILIINMSKDLDLTKAELSRLKESTEGAEKEKLLEQAIKTKDSQLTKLKEEAENLRENLREEKNKSSNLELSVLEKRQENEIIKDQMIKLSSSQPENLSEDMKIEISSIILSLEEAKATAKPALSTKEYCIPAPQLAALVTGSQNILLSLEEVKSKLSDVEKRPQTPDLTAELTQIKQLLNKERESRDQDKKDKEKAEKDWKKREDELSLKLANSVSVEAVNEKVNRLKGELEEKKNLIISLQNESRNLQTEIKIKESDMSNLDKVVSEKSQRLIEMETLKNKLEEAEDTKRRLEEKFKLDRNIQAEELKNSKAECQKSKINLEGATNRIKDLEKQVGQLQQDQITKKNEPSDQLSEAIRSQATLISNLRDKESKANANIQKLKREKEHVTQILEEAQATIEHLKKQDIEAQKQITDMYDQIDTINETLTAKQKEVIDAYREVDELREKSRRDSLKGSSSADDEDLRKRLATIETDNQKRRISEAELMHRVSSLTSEVKLERSRRMSNEAELESKMKQISSLVVDVDSLSISNKMLTDKNIELNQRLLVLKSDSAIDEKFYEVEDEMNRLKYHNEGLNRRIKELNDDLKSNNVRERSLSRENTDLKIKIKNEEIAKIKRTSVESPIKKDLDSSILPPRPDKLSESKSQQQLIDYGPVHDLKMKNITMQQEINQLRNKLKDMESRERRDTSMLNFLKTAEMKSKDVSPIKYEKRGEIMDGDSHLQESILDRMEMSLMRDSPGKINVSKSMIIGNISNNRDDDYGRLRDELHQINTENHHLKNHITALKNELINVAHSRVPPELQSPMSIHILTSVVTKMERSINMSRDVIDLAKNVKKEADAIDDLSNTLRRLQNSSAKKQGHGASSSVDRLGEGAKETKHMIRYIRELEIKVQKFETIIEDLNHKLGKKDNKVYSCLT